MATKIYVMNIEWEAIEKDTFFRLLSSLSETRQKKVLKHRQWADQCRSMGVGLLLDLALKEYGFREREMEYRYGENGKPYFANCPQLNFSLSHSEQMVMAAISDHEIGCDIEAEKQANLCVARRFFSQKEWAFLSAQPSEQQNAYFYRYWVLKESFVKALGTGCATPFSDFTIRLNETDAETVAVCWEKQEYREAYGLLDEKTDVFTEFALPDYRAAVCIRGAEEAKCRNEIFFSFQKLTDMV